MVEAIGNVWYAMVDSKFFAAVATLVTIVLLAFAAPAIASALRDATAEGYTGTAIVQSHKISGSFCNVEVKWADNNIIRETLVFGPKVTCSKVTDGMTVQMMKGDIKH